jgi:hypothetical protein
MACLVVILPSHLTHPPINTRTAPRNTTPSCCLLLIQVDVRALKDLLWDSLVTVNSRKASGDNPNSSSSSSSIDATDADEEQHDSTAAAAAAGSDQQTIPFQDIIVSVPEQSAAGSLDDVSVHMCFICLLHLANERGLVINAKEDLKTLTISNVS